MILRDLPLPENLKSQALTSPRWLTNLGNTLTGVERNPVASRQMREARGGKVKKVREVMGEYKRGTLHSGSKQGPMVKSRAQAKAIAMSEAGVSRK